MQKKEKQNKKFRNDKTTSMQREIQNNIHNL